MIYEYVHVHYTQVPTNPWLQKQNKKIKNIFFKNIWNMIYEYVHVHYTQYPQTPGLKNNIYFHNNHAHVKKGKMARHIQVPHYLIA